LWKGEYHVQTVIIFSWKKSEFLQNFAEKAEKMMIYYLENGWGIIAPNAVLTSLSIYMTPLKGSFLILGKNE